MPLTTAICSECGHKREIRFSMDDGAQSACRKLTHCGKPMDNLWRINFDFPTGPFYASHDTLTPHDTKSAAIESAKRAGCVPV